MAYDNNYEELGAVARGIGGRSMRNRGLDYEGLEADL